MDHFTPIASLIGGLLIGFSASVLLLFDGKIAGMYLYTLIGSLQTRQVDTLHSETLPSWLKADS
jgi:hypothetical protein